MKTHRMILVASAVVALLWAGYRAYRAHANLVTLTVRNMEVRRVVSKLEWQTWERIVVHKSVGGNVTLSVHNVPLDEVLNIVGLQTDSRWTRLYPIYSTPKSLAAFKQVLQGSLLPEGNGWLALQQLAAWQQAGLGGFANMLRAENKLVSAQLVDKDVTFTALALSRFSKAQVVPEDGINGFVNLKLQQVPFEKAVGKVAKQVKRKWNRVYTLQPLNAAALVRQSVPASPDTNASPQLETNQVATSQIEKALPPERALDALVSTMSPEERQQTLEQIAGANQAAGLSPAERQQQMQAGSSPAAQAAQAAQQDLESRIENRLKNGTVDQRIAHDRAVLNNNRSGAKQ
jgi:hypothetical protein